MTEASRKTIYLLTKITVMLYMKNWLKRSLARCKVKSFYKGNQYFLFVTERFEDIRLVGAPPTSIGKFGSDTDNWVFPRHTGDFSMFRIYADANNRPANIVKTTNHTSQNIFYLFL